MKTFRQHWYAPRACATHNLTTGQPVNGAGMHVADDRGGPGATRGFAAVKPFPLDSRGCLIRLESDGEVVITMGAMLTDYYRGTPDEIAGMLERRAAEAAPEDHRPTRAPHIGQDRAEWEASGDGPCEAYRALLRGRAALIAGLAVRPDAPADAPAPR